MVKKSTDDVVAKAVAKAAAKNPSKAKATVETKPKGTATGAARPRNFDYGIHPGSMLAVAVDKMPDKAEDGTHHIGKNLATPYNIIADACAGKGKGIDVNAFNAEGGTRSHIRKLARSGYITITAENGDVFPGCTRFLLLPWGRQLTPH